MRKVTLGITAVLAALILLYAQHANLTGTQGKTDPPCSPTAGIECDISPDKPGENK